MTWTTIGCMTIGSVQKQLTILPARRAWLHLRGFPGSRPAGGECHMQGSEQTFKRRTSGTIQNDPPLAFALAKAEVAYRLIGCSGRPRLAPARIQSRFRAIASVKLRIRKKRGA